MVACVAVLLASFSESPVQAEDVSIHLVDVIQGSYFADLVESLGRGGYELSDGEWVDLDDWYHSDWPEVRIDMLTQLTEEFGILWGVSSGELGEKYEIDPGVKLGFIKQAQVRPNATLTLTATTILGGVLTETPCEADYGEDLGVYTANCRLAATFLSPEETLAYLVNMEPSRLVMSLSYAASF